MDLKTKYNDLADGAENNGKEAGVDKTFSKKPGANVGTGPSDNIADGGGSAEKQPKEHTGNETEMGGHTGGTHGLVDSTKGNDNTGSAE